jgi:Ala-tRNA(Pro) deacylase
MPEIKKVLIPTDLSEHSKIGVRYGLELAESEHASALVFYVADYRLTLPRNAMEARTLKHKTVAEFVADSRAQADHFIRENFGDLVRRLEVQIDADVGVPHERIIQEAEKVKPDMIVMGTHGRTGVGHVLLGSVTEQVLRRADCPVLTVRQSFTPARKLKKFLDEHDIKYVTIAHSKAVTAQEVAESAHIPGKELAKSVIVKLDGQMAMVVLPASSNVDFELLKQATGAKTAELATETEFRSKFPDCEIGAMPPFGNLYGVETFVAENLTADHQIAFNAGSHTELIRLTYKDFERLVNPRVVRVAKA